ncbi:hypothetical protein GCM10009836_07910 [Pseudonocardia ailaonensis]|uniref:OmdA domain containing protein n=1 Tax=Pseudonocardia ailaonensis TaxID=367279 RepID=A0ABN2MMC7_9PSEU
MDTPDVLDLPDAAAFEAWLGSHHDDRSEVHLRIARAGAAHRTLSITDALDVALCHGWIDSVRRRGDEEHYVQRYSPRRRGSSWSERNIARAGELIAAGRMREPGRRALEAGTGRAAPARPR